MVRPVANGSTDAHSRRVLFKDGPDPRSKTFHGGLGVRRRRPGEIDVATLTEGKHWRGQIAHQCEREYQRARWPKCTPANFSRTLEAAKIYLHFRWLGERPEWTLREKTLWRYDH